MFSFEGEYRRKPIQSLGGASKHSQRDIFLQRTQLERQKREELRKQNQSAVVIQAFFRGCRTRVLQKRLLREQFEARQAGNPQSLDLQTLIDLMKQLRFFFHKDQDSAKLVWVSQHVIKSSSSIMKQCETERTLVYSLAQFFNLSLHYLADTVTSAETKGSHWRVLEIFLNAQTWHKTIGAKAADNILGFIFGILSKKGYFSVLRKIVDAKIPPLVEPTTRAPTPLAACLLDFLLQSLEFASNTVNINHSNTIVGSFSREFLESAYSEQVANYILPSLRANNSKIPLANLLHSTEHIQRNPWLLHTILILAEGHAELSNEKVLSSYISAVSRLSSCLQSMQSAEQEGDDDDSDEEDVDAIDFKAAEQEIMQRCLEILNNAGTVQTLVSGIHIPDVLSHVCAIGHNLLLSDRLALHKCRLLYTLAFKPSYLQQLLSLIKSEKQVSLFGSSDTSLVQLLAKGVHLSSQEIQRVVPLLDVFCSLFSHLLVTLDDSEFYNQSGSFSTGAMPFSLSEMVELSSTLRDVCLGLVELAYPETRANASFTFAKSRPVTDSSNNGQETKLWMHLFKSTVNLVRQLHTRDTRRPFCPSWVWVTGRIALPLERNGQFTLRRQGRMHRPFRAIRPLTRNEIEEEGAAMLSTREVRTLAILREIPFVFSFTDRVKMWQQWISSDKMQQQGEANFLRGPSIQVMIRRNYIYEDAFDKLSLDNEPNLRWKMRIQLTNAVGLDEAGVDGGGIFREFLSELLKTSFDPNRGFFRLSADNLLYPNPGVAALVPDFPNHYFFIGRMLGKALYENLLVEIPMADFFLSKILGQASASLDVHHLASLDPVLHKNLLYLRHYDGDVAELGLDFTIVSSELGETKVEELKPNGANIPVTSSNRIEYIHLVADYKLNKQIRLQCNAFRQGLANVIDLEWLQTFSYRELQVLVSGAYIPVDLEDLKAHTHYAGGYTSVHPVIQAFWRVVSKFDDSGKRQLLKFVTSCSRPPLLGFKELDPPFCIQNAGTDDRLPTASTCMNLLKLPEFPNEDVLRERLLYALQSGAGFELS